MKKFNLITICMLMFSNFAMAEMVRFNAYFSAEYCHTEKDGREVCAMPGVRPALVELELKENSDWKDPSGVRRLQGEWTQKMLWNGMTLVASIRVTSRTSDSNLPTYSVTMNIGNEKELKNSTSLSFGDLSSFDHLPGYTLTGKRELFQNEFIVPHLYLGEATGFPVPAPVLGS